MLNYKKSKQENPTSIHTRVNKEVRISSVYRRYANANFEYFGWETLVWNGEKIAREYSPLDNSEEVINQHLTIFNEFI